MLKIKAPIQLKVKKPIFSGSEDFAQRIAGNYELFNMSVTGEDFLHLLSAPPEVFISEGGSSVSIFSNTDITEYNSKKLEVINNFLNRILLSDNVSFTYQDRVFISDVLHKLGITEISSFMKRVENIRNEQQDFSRRLEAYWNHSEEMKALVEEYISNRESSTESTSITNEEMKSFLHQSIFKRLQTGAVYQIVTNFNQEERGVDVITSREILNSEQKETAEKLLLQSLINEVRGEELPLVYKNENFYENEAALPSYSDEEARKNIVAAALLSVIRSTFVSRREENISYGPQWYRIAENLFMSEENTFQRITENLHRNMQLIDAGVIDLTSFLSSNEKIYESSDFLTNIDARTAEISHYLSEGYEETAYDISQNIDRSESETATIVNIDNSFSETSESSVTKDESVDKRVAQNIRQETIRSIQENNMEMRQTYEAHLNALTQNFEASRPRRTKEEIARAQKEALTHPEIFLTQFNEEKEQEEKRQREFDRARSELALTKSPDAFTLIQQFLENPELIPEGVTITRNDIGSLIYDNRQVENSYRQIEHQLSISEERLRRLEQMGISRTALTYLTENEIREFERGEIEKSEIERLIDSRSYEKSIKQTGQQLEITEERIQKLEQMGISRLSLTYLTQNEISEFERGEVDKNAIERLVESRTAENYLKLSEQQFSLTEERLQRLEQMGINRFALTYLTQNEISEFERGETDRLEIERIAESRAVDKTYSLTDRQFEISEERIKSLEEQGISRSDLTYLTLAEINEFEQEQIDKAVIEHIAEDRKNLTINREIERQSGTDRTEIRRVSESRSIEKTLELSDQQLNLTEERLQRLEQMGISRLSLTYLTQNEIGEFERGEIEKNTIERIAESRAVDKTYSLTDRQFELSEERIRNLEQQGINRLELTFLTLAEINEFEQEQIDKSVIEHIAEDRKNLTLNREIERQSGTDRIETEHVLEREFRDEAFRQTEQLLGITEERIQKLEQMGVNRLTLTYLTQNEISEFERGETDITHIEHIADERRRITEQTETENRLVTTESTLLQATERELDRARFSKVHERGITTETEYDFENLSLVHKREETGINEEILEEIQKNRNLERNIVEQHTVEERHVTDEKVINTVVEQRLREQERRLDDLVQEGMSRQINNLSDRVYRQIEKRLANERSRRGV